MSNRSGSVRLDATRREEARSVRVTCRVGVAAARVCAARRCACAGVPTAEVRRGAPRQLAAATHSRRLVY